MSHSSGNKPSVGSDKRVPTKVLAKMTPASRPAFGLWKTGRLAVVPVDYSEEVRVLVDVLSVAEPVLRSIWRLRVG
jgi:hypothetical protein